MEILKIVEIVIMAIAFIVVLCRIGKWMSVIPPIRSYRLSKPEPVYVQYEEFEEFVRYSRTHIERLEKEITRLREILQIEK